MYLFRSEVVAPGHSDKCVDIIVDSIVDKLIMCDASSRVASEVFVIGKHVIIGGEVTTNAKMTKDDYTQLVKDTLIKLSTFVMESFPLTPNWITKKFTLDKPSKDTFLYAYVAARGQVGQSDYPSEQLDKLELFKYIVR